jgi:beta-lactamase superfamily II metal-dependent hydrolase
MRIDIHDVDHGGCAVVTSWAGHRLMLDCGRSSDRLWSPSDAYRGQHIDTLMLMNLDEDHVEDLVALWRACSIGAIFSNPTITPAALRFMKAQGGMRSGVSHAHDILEVFGTSRIGNWSHPLGGIAWAAYWNRFGSPFVKTNDLSLAVFVRVDGVTILFGGDMECAGWKALLQNPNFRAELADVQIYVASHHGRANGQCDELFNHLRPEVVIFSDGPKQYETQETHQWYAQRARGIPDYTRPQTILGQPERKVITTRNDGSLRIDVNAGRYLVTSEASMRWPLLPQPNALRFAA